MTDQIDEALAKLTRLIQQECDQSALEDKSMGGFGKELVEILQDDIKTNPTPNLTRDEVDEVLREIKNFRSLLKSREGTASKEDLLTGWQLVLTARSFVFAEQMKIVRAEAQEQSDIEESSTPEDSADEIELEVMAIEREIERRKTINLSDRSTLLGLGYEFLTTQNHYIFYPLLALHRSRDELKLRIKKLRSAPPPVSKKEGLFRELDLVLEKHGNRKELVEACKRRGCSDAEAEAFTDEALFHWTRKHTKE